jgi:phosphonate transport system permease protein
MSAQAILAAHKGSFFKQNRYAITGAIIIAYTAFCFWLFEIDLGRLVTGIDKMWIVIRSMIYWKDFWSWDFQGIAVGMAQTLAMAFLGTLVASVLALPIGFMAARNVNPFGPARHAVRRVLDLLRGVDTLIWALIYVRAVGLGPLAGVLAIITSDTGTFSKLYSEAVENIDNKQVEGVTSTGAGRLQTYRFGMLPQIMPVFLSISLYFFESNTRSATILGIVGAGGIGLQLSERMRVALWDQACFIIIVILVTVAIIDTISRFIRERFIGVGDAKRH